MHTVHLEIENLLKILQMDNGGFDWLSRYSVWFSLQILLYSHRIYFPSLIASLVGKTNAKLIYLTSLRYLNLMQLFFKIMTKATIMIDLRKVTMSQFDCRIFAKLYLMPKIHHSSWFWSFVGFIHWSFQESRFRFFIHETLVD